MKTKVQYFEYLNLDLDINWDDESLNIPSNYDSLDNQWIDKNLNSTNFKADSHLSEILKNEEKQRKITFSKVDCANENALGESGFLRLMNNRSKFKN